MKRSIEGSIYQSKDKKGWFARLQYNDNEGRRREKKRICKSHALAKAKIDELRLEIEKELSDRKTFRQVDAFFRERYVHPAKYVGGKKVSGFRQDTRIIERYLDLSLEHFGECMIDEISFADLEEYKQKLTDTPTIHGRTRSVADVNQNLRRLRRLFNVAVEQGWLDVNPFKRGRSLISDSFEVERTRILTREEEKKLLANCTGQRKHLVPIIVFAIETGLRRGEINSLEWTSVDLGRRMLKVESLNAKTLKSRLVPLSARAADALKQLWQNSTRRQSTLVFGGIDFKRGFNSACNDASLSDLHFHDLRHTAITRMLEAGISPPLVMKISGHTQQKTFLRYVNQSEASIFDIAMRLDQAA